MEQDSINIFFPYFCLCFRIDHSFDLDNVPINFIYHLWCQECFNVLDICRIHITGNCFGFYFGLPQFLRRNGHKPSSKIKRRFTSITALNWKYKSIKNGNGFNTPMDWIFRIRIFHTWKIFTFECGYSFYDLSNCLGSISNILSKLFFTSSIKWSDDEIQLWIWILNRNGFLKCGSSTANLHSSEQWAVTYQLRCYRYKPCHVNIFLQLDKASLAQYAQE